MKPHFTNTDNPVDFPRVSVAEDPRCCGSGACIINDQGQCWCGQSWNGEQMCFPDTPESKEHTNV